MTVEIGDGRKDNITVCQEDNPLELAQQFCNKHNLGSSLVPILKNYIITNLQSQATDQKQTQNDSTILNQSSQNNAKQRGSSLHSYSQRYEKMKQSKNKSKTDSSYCKNSASRNTSEKSRQFKESPNNSKQKAKEKLEIEIQQQKQNQKQELIEIVPFQSPFNSIQSSKNKFKFSENANSKADIGQKLYYQGMKSKEEQIRLSAEYRKQMQQEEDKVLTFSPNLERRKKENQSKQSKQSRNGSIENSLIQKGKQKEKALDKARIDRILQQQSECSFIPQVSVMSQKIIKRRSQNRSMVDICSQLYEENKVKQEKQRQLVALFTKAQCSFHPDIGINKEKKRDEKRSEFLERLSNSKKENKIKIEEMRKKHEYEQYVVDPQTGLQ